jgi:hypothetical protein
LGGSIFFSLNSVAVCVSFIILVWLASDFGLFWPQFVVPRNRLLTDGGRAGGQTALYRQVTSFSNIFPISPFAP